MFAYMCECILIHFPSLKYTYSYVYIHTIHIVVGAWEPERWRKLANDWNKEQVQRRSMCNRCACHIYIHHAIQLHASFDILSWKSFISDPGYIYENGQTQKQNGSWTWKEVICWPQNQSITLLMTVIMHNIIWLAYTERRMTSDIAHWPILRQSGSFMVTRNDRWSKIESRPFKADSPCKN